jgi:hypothetical protein
MDPVNGASFYFNKRKLNPKSANVEVVGLGSATPITRLPRNAMEAFPPMNFSGARSPAGDIFERRHPAANAKPACPAVGQNCGTNPLMQFGQKAQEFVRKKLFTQS